MKCDMYLQSVLSQLQISIFLYKIESIVYTSDLANFKYLFSHSKYNVEYIPNVRQVIDTYFSSHNMKRGMYL